MKLLRKVIHPSLSNDYGTVFIRHTARAIVLKDEQILLYIPPVMMTTAYLAVALMKAKALSKDSCESYMKKRVHYKFK